MLSTMLVNSVVGRALEEEEEEEEEEMPPLARRLQREFRHQIVRLQAIRRKIFPLR